MANTNRKYVEHVELGKTKDNKTTYLLPKNNLDGITVETDYTGKSNDSTLNVYLPTIENVDGDKITRSPFGIFNLDGTTINENLFNDIVDDNDEFIGASSSTTDPDQLPFNIFLLGQSIILTENAANKIMGNTI